VTTVAVFNDAGLMLQATEQNLGLALSREILAADALSDGRLVQLSPVTIVHADAQPYHFVYPPSLRTWPPLLALREWLRDELDRSDRALRARREPAGKRGKRGT
jgi:LysR family glycine cleavage system transcriptional activator